MEALDKSFYTWNDYKEWEGRWELIDGEAYDMAPAPYPKHQKVILLMAHQIVDQLECEECEVYVSPIDWKIDELNVVQPDIAIFCEEPTEQYFSKTPPFIVEVLSRSTAEKDIGVKFELYEKQGVEWYLIVEPNSEVVDIFHLEEGKYALKKKLAREGRYHFEIGECAFEMDFSKVFG